MKVFGGKRFPTVCFRPAGLRSRKRAGCPRTVEPSSALSSLHCPRTPSPYSWTDRMPGPGEGVGIMKGRPCLPTSAQVNGGRLSLQLRRKRCWEDESLSWGEKPCCVQCFFWTKNLELLSRQRIKISRGCRGDINALDRGLAGH